MTILDRHSEDIRKLCYLHNVGQLYAFGSVLTEKFNDNSDVDLLVNFESVDLLSYGDNYYDLKFSLEEILQKPVDLLEEKLIRNPHFREALHQQRQLIYER